MSDPFELESFFPFLLSRLSNRISDGIASTYSNRYDLKVSEWRLLCLIGSYPGLSAGEVARRGELDKVAVSRSVSRLIGRQLIVRTFAPSDRRRSILHLSAQGQIIFDDITPAAMNYNQALLDCLTPHQRQTLLDSMDQLWRQVDSMQSLSQT